MSLVHYRVQLPHGSDPARGPGWTELLVRDGTSDVDVIDETWIHDLYHLRGLDLQTVWSDPVLTIGGEVVKQSQPIGPRVLDIGACTGIFTALVCQLFPDVEVVAVEPDLDNYGLLTLNTAPHKHRVRLINAAVGAHTGTTTLFGSEGTGHTEHNADTDDGGRPVKQVALDDLIDKWPVALLKIDVEGAEYAMLAASEQLRYVDHIALEWHGTEMAPWVDDAPRRYGEMLTKLARTHHVDVHGYPERGGALYAHRYPD